MNFDNLNSGNLDSGSLNSGNFGARDRELRNALVSTATLSKYSRLRVSPKLAIAAIATFALVGAVTGGSVAASAAVASARTASISVVQFDAQSFVKEQDATIVGPSISGQASGSLRLELGAKPQGATGYVISSTCQAAGDYVESVSGQRDGGGSCDSNGRSPSAEFSPVTTDRPIVFTFTAAASAQLTAFAAWVNAPAIEPSAAESAEIADGVVTRAEYLAAFNRFAGCLAAAGYPLGNVDQSASVLDMSIPGAAVDSGADNRCYLSEWSKVDSLWQQEDWKNTTFNLLAQKCLTAQGITPDMTSADALSTQLSANVAARKCAGSPN